MFGISRPGAAAYRQLSVTSDALAASPHQLVLMLFDGALDAISTAQAQIDGNLLSGALNAVINNSGDDSLRGLTLNQE